MPSVHLSNVSFSYSRAAPLLSGVSLDIGPGWSGVVGANGAGKSTLLKLVAGEIFPDTGAVTTAPPGALTVMCRQRVDEIVPAVEELAGSWDPLAVRLLALLDLDPDSIDRWDSLSPGERTRWQIGGALARDPDVLLLDEPTNHLDADGRQALVASLKAFRGVGLLVSHDRHLLDLLTRSTIQVASGAVRKWSGPYSAARDAWEAEAADLADRHAADVRSVRSAERRVRNASDRRAGAEATAKRERRTADPRDSDARSTARTGRIAAAEQRIGRIVRVEKRGLERSREAAAESSVREDRIAGDFVFVSERAPMEWPLSLDVDVLAAGETVLARDVGVGVRRSDRIRVTGPNGAGKSTLLVRLVSASKLPSGRLLFLPQETGADDSAAIMGDVRSMSREGLGRLLQLVSVLGVDPERLLATGLPSPGETRVLAIAQGLHAGAWVFVLDEPTNHLAVSTIDRLEQALARIDSALVLVTHDERLAAAVTTIEWRLGDGGLTVIDRS